MPFLNEYWRDGEHWKNEFDSQSTFYICMDDLPQATAETSWFAAQQAMMYSLEGEWCQSNSMHK